MSHLCEDHGHYCQTCEDERWEQERAEWLRDRVSWWNWNLSPTECAQDIIANEERGSPCDWFNAMSAFGFTSEQVYDVEIAHDALA